MKDKENKRVEKMKKEIIKYLEKDYDVKLRLNENKTERLLDKIIRYGKMIEFELGEESVEFVTGPKIGSNGKIEKFSFGECDRCIIRSLPIIRIYEIGGKRGAIITFKNTITVTDIDELRKSPTIKVTANILLDRFTIQKHICDENVRYNALLSNGREVRLVTLKICISKVSENKFRFSRDANLIRIPNPRGNSVLEEMRKSKVVPRAEAEQIIDALDKFSTVHELI